MYENIHALNFRVNKFSWVPHENILAQKFCWVEIIVHVLLIKQLLATYYTLHTVCYPLQLEVSEHAWKPFSIDNAVDDQC